MLSLLKTLPVGGRVTISACLMAALVFVNSCGGSGGGNTASDGADPDTSLGELTSIEEMIRSDAYAGKLVVYFDESLGVRIDSIADSNGEKQTDGTSITITSATDEEARIASIRTFVEARPSLKIVRSVKDSPDVVDRRRAKLERYSGKTLADWNSVYVIEESDPDEAILLLRELKDTEGVVKVYPQFKAIPQGLSGTPSLTAYQGYIKDEATFGGLNAQAAWSAGVTGTNVQIVDNESGMNFDHEEFSLIKDTISNGGNFLYTPDCAPGFPYEFSAEVCEHLIAHGAAVAGILIAGDNGHGITGFAPSANYVQGSLSSGYASDLVQSTGDGSPIEPGSIWLFEVAQHGKYSSLSCDISAPDDSCQYGIVPVEVVPDVFDAIEAAQAYGITVIEVGGNGQMNLDNPDLYSGGGWDYLVDLNTEDSGAIVVGASEGQNEAKNSFSNCGSRVNAFAWGEGVVTTSYPSGLFGWVGTSSPMPPNDTDNAYFTDSFGGTSSAGAMVAGAAVLVQSYAREQLGHKRYLMPSKMREILVGSGVAQTDSSGCNIGMQPRIDQAMTAVTSFLATVHSAYPQLASDDQLTVTQMLALRDMGVGIICTEYDYAGSDPSCPEEEIFPEGTKISADYDFDGDGRADLVKFNTNSWKVDLSSVGTGGDNYGAWDVTLSFPPLPGETIWPYVVDMNSDGRSDFVAYDKLAGKFYVALTDSDLLRDSTWHGWDWIIDYSSQWHDQYTLDPDDADYSRPFIAQYNSDGYLDIGLVCSDGFVRVDYGDGTPSGLGVFEWSSQLITDTMLAQAPGWAYLPTPGDFHGNGTQFFALKVPDTLPDEGRMYLIPHDGITFYHDYDWMASAPHIFGGNDHALTVGRFDGGMTIGVKNGDWLITDDVNFNSLYTLSPTDIYGSNECHPVYGRFDGDFRDDRAVMCPDEWRIAYTSDEYDALVSSDGARHIPLTYEPEDFELPGRSYVGGISYTYSRQLMEQYQAMYPGDPVPIMVDMMTVSADD
jgi:hypothetical protein